MINEVFYPEMNQTNLLDSDLIVERLYKQYKVKCKEGIELVENKSIKFQYKKDNRNVYYVSESGLKKLEKKYNISYSALLD